MIMMDIFLMLGMDYTPALFRLSLAFLTLGTLPLFKVFLTVE